MSDQKLKIEYYGLSDIGMVRNENQDSFGKFPPDHFDIYSDKGILFVVADGMGGHTGGKQASSIAVESVNTVYFNFFASNPADALKAAIITANSNIYNTAAKSAELSRMGTTCTAMVIKEESAVIGHVGDSRVYRIEKGKIEQLTDDHTQVQAMLKEGILTPEEAKVYPSKSVLARVLGVESEVKVDIIKINLEPGQTYVICSDGLAKVAENEINKIVFENTAEAACKHLVSLANERGGKDNVTVQVIKVEAAGRIEDNSAVKSPPEKKQRKIIPFFILILLSAAIALAGFQFREEIISLFKSKPIADEKKSDPGEITTGNELIQRAELMFNEGNHERAIQIYRQILDSEPMHLGALHGIDKIVSYYFTKGEEMRVKENFNDALTFYRKIEKIQPANERIKNLILFCETRIKLNRELQDSLTNEPEIEVPAVEKSFTDPLTKFNPGSWTFIDIDPNHYTLTGSTIEFSNSSKDKKVVFENNLENASVTIDVKPIDIRENSGFGIIVGYTQASKENYYLFKYTEKNNYTLHKVSGGSGEQLLFVYRESTSSELRLKIVCSENRISIYNKQGLLSSWRSSQPITGKVGFFMDKDIAGSFSNLNITGSKKN